MSTLDITLHAHDLLNTHEYLVSKNMKDTALELIKELYATDESYQQIYNAWLALEKDKPFLLNNNKIKPIWKRYKYYPQYRAFFEKLTMEGDDIYVDGRNYGMLEISADEMFRVGFDINDPFKIYEGDEERGEKWYFYFTPSAAKEYATDRGVEMMTSNRVINAFIDQFPGANSKAKWENIRQLFLWDDMPGVLVFNRKMIPKAGEKPTFRRYEKNRSALALGSDGINAHCITKTEKNIIQSTYTHTINIPYLVVKKKLENKIS